jgi:predicted Zn finger-like uncharacterized protein
MSGRLTRCPACATVFRVTAEQLQSRQGFVRCGQCAKVFDARPSLTEERVATASESEASGDAPVPGAIPPADGVTPAISTDTSPAASLAAQPQATAWPFAPPALAGPAFGRAPGESVAADGDVVAPGATLAEQMASRPSSADAADADAPADDGLSAAAAPVPSDASPATLTSAPPIANVDASATAPSDFEFGPRHRERSRRAAVAWGVGSVLLAAALAAQGAYWFRTELAAAVPEARPYLEAACRPLRCTVPPARETALITIETSELQMDKNVPGLLTLNATLRNRAAFPQQHPSIELTLTDADERPLSRRVLGPPEYLGDRFAREPFMAAASEHSVRLHIDATAIKPTGYRLFLFHP